MSAPTLAKLLACPADRVHLLSTTARRRLAGCPRTSIEMLDDLSFDPDPRVRAAYVRNGTAPLTNMEAMVGDSHPMVRAAIARRRRVPENMIVTLAGDRVPAVRREVASRRRLPWPILTRLLADPDTAVRVTAAASHQLPAAYLIVFTTHASPAWRQVAAASPRLAPDLQRVLAKDPCWQVRRLPPLHLRGNQPLEVAADLALAPELATDGHTAKCLVGQIVMRLAMMHPSDVPPSGDCLLHAKFASANS